MIISKLTGGIGNQLFQYSAGLRLATKHCVPLKLDISKIELEPNRQYRLNCFNLNAKIASLKEIEYMTKPRIYGRRYTFHKLLQRIGLIHLPNTHRHLKTTFYTELLNANGACYLEGYWQSEKYFIDISKELRKTLNFKASYLSDIEKYIEQAISKHSVSIHIRRGDYANNPSINSKHGTCSLDYYHAALEIVKSKRNVDHVYIFSDDTEWVRNNFIIDLPSTIASNFTTNEIQDLALMSMCKYHIIANSSFSWWGAWLSQASNKIVIAPMKWFNINNQDAVDIIPNSWIKI